MTTDRDATPTANSRSEVRVPGPPPVPREARAAVALDEAERRIEQNSQRLAEELELRLGERLGLVAEDVAEIRRMLGGGPAETREPNELGALTQLGQLRALVLVSLFVYVATLAVMLWK